MTATRFSSVRFIPPMCRECASISTRFPSNPSTTASCRPSKTVSCRAGRLKISPTLTTATTSASWACCPRPMVSKSSGSAAIISTRKPTGPRSPSRCMTSGSNAALARSSSNTSCASPAGTASAVLPPRCSSRTSPCRRCSTRRSARLAASSSATFTITTWNSRRRC